MSDTAGMNLSQPHGTIEQAAEPSATPAHPPVGDAGRAHLAGEDTGQVVDAASALLLLDQTVSAYMLGEVDGHEVHRVQELTRPYAAAGPRLRPGRRRWRDRPLPPEATSGLVTRDGPRPGAR